jgi:NADPH:quinone reductase-like Zn-dependent oxidoreductase
MGGFDMADTVKIVRFHEAGQADVLRLEDLPLPEPGPGEVRLRVKAIGLNRAEVMFRNAMYPIDPVFPSNLGYEASGIIEAVGPGVDRSLLGRTMSSVPSFRSDEYGVYGEVAILPVSALAAYPESLSYEEGTSIWMQYITAWGALVHFGKVAPNEHVLITAASSSVGIAGIAVTKAEGAIAIATTRTAAKKEQLLALGADHVIVTDDEDLVSRVMEITAGRGCRIIFDPIAGAGFERLAEAAADFALISLYGVLDYSPMIFPTALAFKRNLTVQAFTIFPLTMNPTTRAAAESYVYDHLENGDFKPLIDRCFQLSDIVAAHRYMETNQQIGKIVVRV